MKTRLFFSLTALIIIILPGLAFARQYDSALAEHKTPQSDTDFILSAAGDGVFEVRMAREALSRSSNLDVRRFAEQIIKDHTEALNSLKAIARSRLMQITPVMDRAHQNILDDMTRTRPEVFDRDFINFMINDHRLDLGLLLEYREKTKDPNILEWIAKALPLVRKHIGVAEELQARFRNR